MEPQNGGMDKKALPPFRVLIYWDTIDKNSTSLLFLPRLQQEWTKLSIAFCNVVKSLFKTGGDIWKTLLNMKYMASTCSLEGT